MLLPAVPSVGLETVTGLYAGRAPLLCLGYFTENDLAGAAHRRTPFRSCPGSSYHGGDRWKGVARHRLCRGTAGGLPAAAATPLAEPEERARRQQLLPPQRPRGSCTGALAPAPPRRRPPAPSRPLGGRRWVGAGEEASPPLRSARCGRRLPLSAAARPRRLSSDAVLAREDDRERRGAELPPPLLPGALSLARLLGAPRLPLADGRQEERAEGRRWFYGGGFVLSRWSVPRRAGLSSSSSSSCLLPRRTRCRTPPAGSGSSCRRRPRCLRGP